MSKMKLLDKIRNFQKQKSKLAGIYEKEMRLGVLSTQQLVFPFPGIFFRVRVPRLKIRN